MTISFSIISPEMDVYITKCLVCGKEIVSGALPSFSDVCCMFLEELIDGNGHIERSGMVVVGKDNEMMCACFYNCYGGVCGSGDCLAHFEKMKKCREHDTPYWITKEGEEVECCIQSILNDACHLVFDVYFRFLKGICLCLPEKKRLQPRTIANSKWFSERYFRVFTKKTLEIFREACIDAAIEVAEKMEKHLIGVKDKKTDPDC
jgi:hypothetical protein